jgi:murein DD-endopeptidase MepM/ murein hydrolase activator NlpD
MFSDPQPTTNANPEPTAQKSSEPFSWQQYLPHLGILLLAVAVVLVVNLRPSRWLTQGVEALSLPPTVPAFVPAKEVVALDSTAQPLSVAIERQINIDTNIPSRPRTVIVEYKVETGDTLYGIADKFGVSAEAILWSNYLALQDDPHSLQPGLTLRIPPLEGVLYTVQAPDTLTGIAKGLKADTEDIIFWPGNDIDPDKPAITPGQVLFVPNGRRNIIIAAPVLAEKRNQSTGRVFYRGRWGSAGAGACAGEEGYAGSTGTQTFVWPATRHVLSGYDYSAIHQGLDVAAALGAPIFASDNGVVVFAGWSDWGYGNMVVVDHNNGWQSLYGHLSNVGVSCGQSVGQGALIGAAGSTGRSSGPHLHFEILFNGGRVNPWLYLR